MQPAPHTFRSIEVRDLGLIPYLEAEKLQAEAVLSLRNGGPETVFLLEHPPTVTFGRNGGKENLPLSQEALAALGATAVQTSRGGNITCHFPGQLVMYPVMRADKRPGGLKRFFHDLEEGVIRTLLRFDLASERKEGYPGVWVNGKKICSIGIAVSHWITSHGLSLNVGPDLSLFEAVTPCGLPDVAATSVCRETGRADISVHSIKPVLVREFLELSRRIPAETRNSMSKDTA